jgi:hypothetical protein
MSKRQSSLCSVNTTGISLLNYYRGGITHQKPGSIDGLLLVVKDIQAAQ